MLGTIPYKRQNSPIVSTPHDLLREKSCQRTKYITVSTKKA
ncbi:MAG: Unknown protein [uncultured Aureispira sp.]|uniref:Uncharacterized protein n=1 Tax=uncultured Aureispira sp. TaxID=1331704 RepID=A0A6S6T1D4_9BACT|nr:MAG: Unknown protein [uncultured Aureispira sp.]